MKERTSDNWIDTILAALNESDAKVKEGVLLQCGIQCCDDVGMLDMAKALAKETKGLSDEDKFAYLEEKFPHHNHNASFYKQDGIIYVEYKKCRCPLTKKYDLQYNDMICECTKGFAKAFMEAVLDAKVEVTILKTIRRGDEKCLLAVRKI